MDGARNTHEGGDKRVFWLQSLKGRGHLKKLGVDRKITSTWILKKFRGT